MSREYKYYKGEGTCYGSEGSKGLKSIKETNYNTACKYNKELCKRNVPNVPNVPNVQYEYEKVVSLPTNIKVIKDFIKKQNFDVNFTDKDYRLKALNLIENNSTNEKCKLDKIFPNWKYAIVDSSKVMYNNLIIIFKRNKDDNLDIVKAYIKFNHSSIKNFSKNNLNNSFKKNFKLSKMKDLLIDDMCILYLI